MIEMSGLAPFQKAFNNTVQGFNCILMSQGGASTTYPITPLSAISQAFDETNQAFRISVNLGDTLTLTPDTGEEGLVVHNDYTNNAIRINQDGELAASKAALLVESDDSLQRNTHLVIHRLPASSTGNVLDITNGGTGRGIQINQDGIGTGLKIINASTDYALHIDQNGELAGAKAALYVESAGQTQGNTHLVVFTLPAGSAGNVLDLTNSGTGRGLQINQVGAGIPLKIVNDSTANCFEVDANGNGIALDIDTEATSADAINIDAVNTSGIVVDINLDPASASTAIALTVDNHTNCTGALATLTNLGSGPALNLSQGHLRFTQVTAPGAATIASISAGGSVNDGNHYYKVTFVTGSGETELGTTSAVATCGAGNNTVNLSAIPTGGATTGTTSRKVYRTKAGGSTYFLVTTIADNTTTTYADAASDASLGTTQYENLGNTTAGRLFIGSVKAGILGTNNTFFGLYSGNANTTGAYNTASGRNSLYSNTTGAYNTASGVDALYYNTTGANNTASGVESNLSNTTGNYNTTSGYRSLRNNTTGSSNTASGYQSLYSNTTGANNTASGINSLRSNTTGANNTASGYYSLFSNTTNNNSTAFGYSALYSSNAPGNLGLGYQAGDNLTSGAYNIVIGYDVDAQSATASNQLVIGNAIFGLTIDGTGTTVSTGNIGIFKTVPTARFHLGSANVSTTVAQIDAVNTSGLVLDINLTSTGASTATGIDINMAPDTASSACKGINLTMGANSTSHGIDIAASGTSVNQYGINLVRSGNADGSAIVHAMKITCDNGGTGSVCGIDFSAFSAGEAVFATVADATDPTGGGGAATGRIAVRVGGSLVYIPYYA